MADSPGSGRSGDPFAGGMLPPGRLAALPSVPTGPRYSMADLEAATPFNARTIRFYIAQGLLASAHGRGPTATYDEDHLLRLRMIAELKAQYLPLDQIGERLAAMTTDDLVAHFAIQRTPNEQRWRRVLVHPDLELHVRDHPDEQRGMSDPAFEAALDQITQHARLVLQHYERGRVGGARSEEQGMGKEERGKRKVVVEPT